MTLKADLAAIGDELEKKLNALTEEAAAFGDEQDKEREAFALEQDKAREAKIAELVKREGEARDEAQKATDAAIDAADEAIAGGFDLMAAIRASNDMDALAKDKQVKIKDVREMAEANGIETKGMKEADMLKAIKATI